MAKINKSNNGRAQLRIEVDGREAVVRAFKQLGDREAPFLRAAIERSENIVIAATPAFIPGAGVSKPSHGRSHTPRASFMAGMAAGPVKGTGVKLRATVILRHPGARSYEFGRSKSYYTGYSRKYRSVREMAVNELTGRRRKQFMSGVSSSLRGRANGQPPRPFIGILSGGYAVAAAAPEVHQEINDAFLREARALGLHVSGRGL